MPKRKANTLENGAVLDEPRRSSRHKSTATTEKEPLPKSRKSKSSKDGEEDASVSQIKDVKPVVTNGKTSEEPKKEKPKPKSKAAPKAPPKPSPSQPAAKPAPATGRQYWLMKAEPESRLEKGHDVKFSIDDLAAKTEPEPWDGIRNHQAKNNLRAMKKGDLAFFYHSSCKIPAIVGIMEIVAEHSPDLSAHDPSAPYHDPTSTPDNPKWSVVHVSFRQKLGTPITLKELREWKDGSGPLKDMQMLNAGRLSVSKVREGEWDFLVEEMGRRGDVVNV